MSKTCNTCGQALPENHKAPAAPSSSAGLHARVVKPGHLFMDVKGGGLVQVKTEHLNHRSTLLATWSMEEHAALVAEARKPKTEPKPDSVDMASKFKARAKELNAREKQREEDAAAAAKIEDEKSESKQGGA